MKRHIPLILAVLMLVVGLSAYFAWQFSREVAFYGPEGHEIASFSVEIADTPKKRSKGLMYRKTLERDSGMIFVFPKAGDVSMWMKNTYIPLDMVFIGGDMKVKCIAADTVPESLTNIECPYKVKYVLEINAGVAAKKGIETGNTFGFK